MLFSLRIAGIALNPLQNQLHGPAIVLLFPYALASLGMLNNQLHFENQETFTAM